MIYFDGENELSDFVRALRPGAIAGVPSLSVLVDTKAKSATVRRRTWWQAWLSILATRAVIEDDEGRRTDNPKQLWAMVEDAVEDVTLGKRRVQARINGAKSRGRKPDDFPDSEVDRAGRMWDATKRYATTRDAIKAMGGAWTMYHAYRRLGQRGSGVRRYGRLKR